MQIERLSDEEFDADERPEAILSEQLRFWRRSIRKHYLAILLLTLLVGAIAALFAYSMTPVYKATATLYVEPNKARVVAIESVYASIVDNQEHLQTQLQILKSRALAEKLVEKLHLTTNPATDPRQRPPTFNLPIHLRDWLPAAWLPHKRPISQQGLNDATVSEVESDLDAQLVRLTYLINVGFESTDPTLATKMANTMADVYIDNDLESRLLMTRKASAWLEGHIKGLRANLDASVHALQQFRDKTGIVDASGTALGISSQLTSETTALVAARQRVAELQDAYRQVQAVMRGKSHKALDSIPAVLRSPSVIPFKTAEAEAQRKLAELSNRYGARHPKIIAAKAALRIAHENTERAVDAVAMSITRKYEVAKATEQALQRSLDRSKADIQDLSRKQFKLASLERAVKTNQQLYDLFVKRAKQTAATSDLQSPVARVIDPAVVPTSPVKPRKTLIISIALFSGLLLGVLLALLLEYLDNTVRSTEDVATKLSLPLLGMLPLVPGKYRNFELERAILENVSPALSEAVRTLRTGLLMSALDDPHKVVLVTSSVPEEGKTMVSTNLAFALAQVKRTCLIDADMRRPSVDKALGGNQNMPGLSNLVADTEPASKCIHEHPSGLCYIPSGPIPPNPSELLSSHRFAEVVSKLSAMFDVIVIDSPPVQLVSDATILAGVANAFVFVTRADSTPYQVAKGAVEQLKKGKAKLLGVVLNRLDVEKSERYYGYGRYFSYGGKYKHYKRYGYYGGAKK